MATAKEFVEFWLTNSVYPDGQFGVRSGRAAIQYLADSLIRAAAAEGFTRTQVEIELSDSIYAYIRRNLDEPGRK